MEKLLSNIISNIILGLIELRWLASAGSVSIWAGHRLSMCGKSPWEGNGSCDRVDQAVIQKVWL